MTMKSLCRNLNQLHHSIPLKKMCSKTLQDPSEKFFYGSLSTAPNWQPMRPGYAMVGIHCDP